MKNFSPDKISSFQGIFDCCSIRSPLCKWVDIINYGKGLSLTSKLDLLVYDVWDVAHAKILSKKAMM